MSEIYRIENKTQKKTKKKVPIFIFRTFVLS